MGKQMKNAPVYFVIGQVRFNPSPVPIKEHMTEIQEGFRKLGFSDYRPKKLQQMSLIVQGEQLSQSPGETVDLFEFANPERTVLFQLDPNQLSFQTVDYKHFEDFSVVFSKAFDLLTRHVKLTFIERVGLRYLDAVIPKMNEDLKLYLHPQLLGLSALADGLSADFSVSEALMNQGQDKILARVALLKGKLGFPQDLANVDMKIDQRFRDHDGPFAILDNDAFCTERHITRPDEPLAQTVMATFARLRALIDTVFQKSVTPMAKQVWEGEP